VEFSGHDVVGGIGVFVTILSYFLLQISYLKIENIPFSAINAFGSIMILYSLYYESNFSSILMESIWLMMSTYGMIKILLQRKQLKKQTRIISDT
jgi:hypothetical protein